VVAHLTRAEDGQAIGIAGTLADVTQGRQAEYERRRGEESIRGLYAIISSQEMSFSAKSRLCWSWAANISASKRGSFRMS